MKILIAEKNPEISALILNDCLAAGYQVASCQMEEYLVDLLSQELPQLLILDFNFSKNNQVLLNELRKLKNTNEMPILFVYNTAEEKNKIFKLEDSGEHDIISKSFDVKDFMSRLKILIKLATTQSFNRVSLKMLDQLNVQLTKEHLKFLKIMELIPVGIIIYNEDSLVEFMNHDAELLTGYQSSFFLNQSIETIYEKLGFKEKLENILKNQGVSYCRDTLINKHNRNINIERKCLNIEGKDKKNICKVDVFRDITTALELEILLEARIEERSQGIMATQNITMMALASLAESRDNETGMHLERMRTYSQMIAQDLLENNVFSEVNAQFVIDIYSSSPLHDIGKVGTPDYVLLKPGKLSVEEWEIMKMHPVIGAKTLQDAINQGAHASFLEMARDICLGHHERIDGSGYPKGSKGASIPLSARIVALADCYDALRSARIYKKAFSHEESKQFILEKAGVFYDQQVVEAFIRIENKIIATAEKFRDEEEKPNIDISNIRR